MSRPRAADDFTAISDRMAELQRERAQTINPVGDGETNLKGDPIGPCFDCQRECVPCSGVCYG